MHRPGILHDLEGVVEFSSMRLQRLTISYKTFAMSSGKWHLAGADCLEALLVVYVGFRVVLVGHK